MLSMHRKSYTGVKTELRGPAWTWIPSRSGTTERHSHAAERRGATHLSFPVSWRRQRRALTIGGRSEATTAQLAVAADLIASEGLKFGPVAADLAIVLCPV